MRCCSRSWRWRSGSGDAVITTPFTFFATAGTIARTGATPLFCDIDPVTFNLSPAGGRVLHRAQLRACAAASWSTAARVAGSRRIMPVHLYGQMADMPRAHGDRAATTGCG